MFNINVLNRILFVLNINIPDLRLPDFNYKKHNPIPLMFSYWSHFLLKSINHVVYFQRGNRSLLLNCESRVWGKEASRAQLVWPTHWDTCHRDSSQFHFNIIPYFSGFYFSSKLYKCPHIKHQMFQGFTSVYLQSRFSLVTAQPSGECLPSLVVDRYLGDTN